MPVPERPQKQTPIRSKPAPAPAHDSAQTPEFVSPIPMTSQFSPAALISLQRMVGNQAVQRMLTPSKPNAIQRIPFEVGETLPSASESAGDQTIQRQIKKLSGASSGWFRKGHRDKINEMVDAYNIMETKLSG